MRMNVIKFLCSQSVTTTKIRLSFEFSGLWLLGSLVLVTSLRIKKIHLLFGWSMIQKIFLELDYSSVCFF